MQLCKQDEGQTDDIKLKSTPQRNPEDPKMVKARGLFLLVFSIYTMLP